MKEQKRRSILKAVTYRTLATFATFTVAYILTGSLELATSIGLIDSVIKFILYYVNERVWLRTKWGYQASKR
jgi:uncharacterized membrane protein